MPPEVLPDSFLCDSRCSKGEDDISVLSWFTHVLPQIRNRYDPPLHCIGTRAEKSERRKGGKSRKGGKRREKVEKSDLVMQLDFWQTCQNAIKCHEMISVHPMLNM